MSPDSIPFMIAWIEIELALTPICVSYWVLYTSKATDPYSSRHSWVWSCTDCFLKYLAFCILELMRYHAWQFLHKICLSISWCSSLISTPTPHHTHIVKLVWLPYLPSYRVEKNNITPYIKSRHCPVSLYVNLRNRYWKTIHKYRPLSARKKNPIVHPLFCNTEGVVMVGWLFKIAMTPNKKWSLTQRIE